MKIIRHFIVFLCAVTSLVFMVPNLSKVNVSQDTAISCEKSAVLSATTTSATTSLVFTYEDNINYSVFDAGGNGEGMTSQEHWAYEDGGKYYTAPTIENGVLCLDTEDSFQFNWTKLVSYNTSHAYNFEFDFKVTNLGNGHECGSTNMTRALYVAFGGYYNQLEINDVSNRVRAGDTYANDVSTYFNKPLRSKITLEGNKVYTTIYDSENNILLSGVRTNDAYTNMESGRMPVLTFRCEDGAVEIDNIKFTVTKSGSDSFAEIEIPEGKSAQYSCEVDFKSGNNITIQVNGSEMFNISAQGARIGGATTNGEFGYGKYKVSITIDPKHRMLAIEVVLPTGKTIRRGSYIFITQNESNYAVTVLGNDVSKVSNSTITYGDVSVEDYEILTTEPVYSGYNANIYNIITSFSDASTTRSFAFTALSSYVNGEDMMIAYRVKGEEAWLRVQAQREKETINEYEDYYKADIFGLKSSTEYEYKIDKRSVIDQNSSRIYSFKTASDKIEEFTFVAVGDTQGVTWNGTSSATKGFMFAKATYDQAIKNVQDPAFILHTGDVVENAHTEVQWNMFFKALGDIGTEIPHFATIGNHDVHNLNPNGAEFYYDFHFNHPNNGGASALDSTWVDKITNDQLKALTQAIDETIYSYDYGDAHFVVIASGNYTNSDQYLLEAQRAWLDADLKANADAKWKVVMFHEPVYHRMGGKESRPWLYDVIEKNGVDLVIQGHSHVVTRTYPMKNGVVSQSYNADTIIKGDGTVYTTIGATAYNHDGFGDPNMEELFLITTPAPELPTYTTVTINENKLIMTIKQIDGLIVDQFEILAEEEYAGHTGNIITVGKKSPTCAQKGYTGDKVCEDCEQIVKFGEAIEVTDDHTFIQKIHKDYLIREATCTEYPLYHKSCKTCGKAHESETFEDISVIIGHDLEEVVDSENLCLQANCKNKAKYYKTCKVCKQKSSELFEYGLPKEHNWDNIVKNEAKVSSPSCDQGAIYKKSCIDCGTLHESETFEYGMVAGHDWKNNADDKYLVSDATCNSQAKYKVSCSRCGIAHESETFALGNTLGHSYVYKTTVEPSWGEKKNGYDLYECENDPTHTEQRNIVYWSTLSSFVLVVDGTVNGAESTTVEKGATVTVIANTIKGKTFKHWEIDGEVVSEDEEYSFVANDSYVSVKAVYDVVKENKPKNSGCGQNATEILGLVMGICALAFVFKKR